MTHGIHGTSPFPPQDSGLGRRNLDADVLRTVMDFMLPGVSFEQAVQDAVDAGALDRADLERSDLAGLTSRLDGNQQRQLAERADAIPQAMRTALEQLGIVHAETPPSQRAEGAAVRDGTPASPAALAPGERVAAAGLHNDAAGVQFAQGVPGTREAVATQAATPQAVPTAPRPGDAAIAWLGRPADVAAGVRPGDAGPIPAAPDRASTAATQAALQQQAVLAPQGRADALPAQVLPQAAGAAVLATSIASPQGTVATPQMQQAPAPAGSTTASASVRERAARIAPAGHTVESASNRPATRGAPKRSRSDGIGMTSLLSLLSARGNDAGEDEQSQFQWLFWILTLLAYGALAVAAFAILSGPGLVGPTGNLGYGTYALVIGAAGALGSWLVGRRIFRRR